MLVDHTTVVFEILYMVIGLIVLISRWLLTSGGSLDSVLAADKCHCFFLELGLGVFLILIELRFI